jgi:adenylate cyclase
MTAAERRRLVDSNERRLLCLSWIAGTVGAVIVFTTIGFLIAVFLDPGQRDSIGKENLPYAVASVFLGGLALKRILHRKHRRAFEWIVEDRDPTDAEHRRALAFPAWMAMIDVITWALSALAFGAINLHHGAGFAAVVVVAIWLGGETTSALIYLFTERIVRPLTAMTLAARLPERSAGLGLRSGILGIRNRLLFAWSLGTGVPIIGVLTVGIVGITKGNVDPEYVGAACVFLAVVASLTGLLATITTARAIADPITSVQDAVSRLAAGELDAQVTIDDASEVGLLQAAFNRMAEGLRERERIRDLFGRHVGRDVAAAALGKGTRLGGEERMIGALFVDITGSTAVALAMPPTEVVRLLNRFFHVVIEVVEENGGFVNKFEGDAALCVFGAPAPCDDPAGQALCAARKLAERLDREVAEVGFGIGISAGRAVAGNVGSEDRFEYTVIGDPVNEAARLCDVAKQRSWTVVASAGAVDRAGSDEAAEWESRDREVLRGRLEATGLAVPRALREPSRV